MSQVAPLEPPPQYPGQPNLIAAHNPILMTNNTTAAFSNPLLSSPISSPNPKPLLSPNTMNFQPSPILMGDSNSHLQVEQLTQTILAQANKMELLSCKFSFCIEFSYVVVIGNAW